jgi:hypothetical protein
MSYGRIGLCAIAMTTACEWGPQYCEGDWAAAPPEAAPPIASARTVAQVLPVESNAVDILFVIDDSRSMTDEQTQLGIWSSKLFEVLSGTGELPDLHIGVTSSSIVIPNLPGCTSGAGGAFLTGGATLQKTRFLSDVATATGERERNYTGRLTDAFAMMARVGDGGCGFEQPLKAARMALSSKTDAFLRPDALLLVVFVTDEDDCSARTDIVFGEPRADACSDLGTPTSYRCFEHGVKCYDGKGSREFGMRRNCRADESSPYMESVSSFAAFLKGLKPDPAQVVVAAIYGKPNHVEAIKDERVTTHDTPRLADVCGRGGKEGTGATPAIRMNALLAEFGGRASQSSICDGELSWAMRDVGLITRGAATRSHCLRGPLSDLDATSSGIQPACRLESVSSLGRVEVPPCDQAPGQRCFTIATDEACADTETQLAFHITDSIDGETLSLACDVENAEQLAFE